MKTFLGVPILDSTNLWGLMKHYLLVILFSGFGYIFLSLIAGTITGDVWGYFQSTEKHPLMQAFLLLGGVLVGLFFKSFATLILGDNLFHLPKYDKYFYPLAIIVVYLELFEVWGL